MTQEIGDKKFMIMTDIVAENTADHDLIIVMFDLEEENSFNNIEKLIRAARATIKLKDGATREPAQLLIGAKISAEERVVEREKAQKVADK